MIPFGAIAQEATSAVNLPPPSETTDVVFQCSWSGTPGGTDAVDESFLHAPISFFNGAVLDGFVHIFDAATSLATVPDIQYVSVPLNSAYHIGDGDFTIEQFLRVHTFRTQGAMQLIGLWSDEVSSANQEWRIVIDSVRIYFQAYIGTDLLQYQFDHTMLTDSWYYVAWCRTAGTLRAFFGQPGGMAANVLALPQGSIYPHKSTDLYISGNLGSSISKVSLNGWAQHTRVTRNSWYRTNDAFPVPDHRFGYGSLFPSLVPADDVFFAPSVSRQGQINPPLITIDDTFFAPHVSRSPTFVNGTTTNGATGSSTATVTLVGSRTTGNLLICFVQTTGGSRTFTVGGGWTIGDQQNNANTSACWLWRYVDGTEAAPAVAIAGGATTWHGHMYQFSDVKAVTPIGSSLKSIGASSNLIVNGGVGLTTTANVSSVFAITLTSSSSQVIPLPSGYTAAGTTFNDANGSDRGSYQPQALAGTVSNPINLTITSAFWHGFMIELLSK